MELWATVLTSSAVGSLVGMGGSLYMKWRDRQREDEKDKQRIGHVYLDVALQLEAFAKAYGTRMLDIDRGLWERIDQHDESYLNGLRPFVLAFDPVPNWAELPVAFAARMKVFPGEFAATNDWLRAQWNSWADTEEIYNLETQQLAHYGFRACQIAGEIRKCIVAGTADNTALVKLFTAEIEKCFSAFAKNRHAVNLIPDLDAEFRRRLPATPDDDGAPKPVTQINL